MQLVWLFNMVFSYAVAMNTGKKLLCQVKYYLWMKRRQGIWHFSQTLYHIVSCVLLLIGYFDVFLCDFSNSCNERERMAYTVEPATHAHTHGI